MKKIILHLLLSISIFNISAQDLMLQGWYWDYPKTCNGGNWAQTLTNQANDFQNTGFTYVWLPPLSRASFGNCSVGYDPKDLYDLGENYGGGATGFGTRTNLNNLITQLNQRNIEVVADMVYNHRDGGKPEINPALKSYYDTYYNGNKSPFPSDRYRCIIPLGGNSGNGAGDYYFKISSISKKNSYFNNNYKFYTATKLKTGFAGNVNENENNSGNFNGGSDCGQGFNAININQEMIATLDDSSANTGFCFTDEFKLTIQSGDFNASGDTLYIYMRNNGQYTDHKIYGIWNAAQSADISNQLQYQTYTNFASMPSGKGQMTFENFKPNSQNASTTYLAGDWDWLWFFYDYDQFNPDTKSKLFDWSTWMWDSVGIRGYRMDAVKHFNPDFVGDLMDHFQSKNIKPGMVVGEYYDANSTVVKGWLDGVYASMDANTQQNIQVKAFDFNLRDALKASCDNFGYDVRNVFQSGLVNAGASPFQSVTFVNNHDFRDAGQPVQNDVMLAYAYILTNNQIGTPCVFYPEYAGVSIPNAPTVHLQAEMDTLWSIHQNYIFGANQIDYLTRFNTPYVANFISGFANTSLVYQIHGGITGKEVLVAINFAGDTLKLDQGINTSWLSLGDTLYDVLGKSSYPYAIVQLNGVYLQVPPRSYSVWVNNTNLTTQMNTLSAEKENRLEIFPNPAHNEFYLKLNSSEIIQGIKIYSLDNQLLKHQNSDFRKVNLEGFPSGVYQIEVKTENSQYFQKLIKE